MYITKILIVLITQNTIIGLFADVEKIAEDSLLISNAISRIIENVKSRGSLGVCISMVSSDSTIKKTSEDLLNLILSKNNQSTFLIQKENFQQFQLQATSKYFNIFLIESYESFQRIYKKINPPQFDYEGKFLIVAPFSNDHLIRAIINDLWKINIIHVNILIRSPDENEVHLYTFFPFTKDFCHEIHPVVWKVFKNGEFSGHESFYPNKVQKMHKCIVSVTSFYTAPFMIIHEHSKGYYDYHGLDGNLLTMLSERMNFKINLTVLPEESLRWGTLLPNGSSTGAIKMVKNHSVLILSKFLTIFSY